MNSTTPSSELELIQGRRRRVGGVDVRVILFLAAALALSILLATSVSAIPPKITIIAAMGVLIFLIAFADTELGLIILVFAFLLSPELDIGGGGGQTLEQRRHVVLRVEDILLAIFSLTWLVRTAIYKELGLVLRTPLNKAVAFYGIACIVSTSFSYLFLDAVTPKSAFFFVLKYIEFYFVFFLVVNFVQNKLQVRHLVIASLVTCFIVALFGISQIPGGERVTAPFEGEAGEPNTLGGYLIFMLAIVLGLYSEAQSHKQKLLLAALGILIALPFVYTQSRGSWLAAPPMFAAIMIMSRKRGTILLAALAIAGIILILKPGVIVDRFLETFYQEEYAGQIKIPGVGVTVDTSVSARIKSWEYGLEKWKKHPVFGWGVTGLGFLDAQYVRTLAETGLVGILAFLYLLYSMFINAWRSYRTVQDPFHKGLAMGYLAGFIALMTHAIGANTFIIVRIMMPLYFFTGIIIILPRLEQESAEKKELAWEEENEPPGKRSAEMPLPTSASISSHSPSH